MLPYPWDEKEERTVVQVNQKTRLRPENVLLLSEVNDCRTSIEWTFAYFKWSRLVMLRAMTSRTSDTKQKNQIHSFTLVYHSLISCVARVYTRLHVTLGIFRNCIPFWYLQCSSLWSLLEKMSLARGRQLREERSETDSHVFAWSDIETRLEMIPRRATNYLDWYLKWMIQSLEWTSHSLLCVRHSWRFHSNSSIGLLIIFDRHVYRIWYLSLKVKSISSSLLINSRNTLRKMKRKSRARETLLNLDVSHASRYSDESKVLMRRWESCCSSPQTIELSFSLAWNLMLVEKRKNSPLEKDW